MGFAVQKFLTEVFDGAWMTELLLISLAWVLLCAWGHRGSLRWGVYRIFRNVAGLFLTLIFANFLIYLAANGRHFPMLWNVVLGCITVIYFLRKTNYKQEVKLVIWCSMFAGMCSLMAIAGQFSFLWGNLVEHGAFEGVIRCFVYFLCVPLAIYLANFDFSKYERVPRSGLYLILADDLALLGLMVMEDIWLGMDYRIIATLAMAYVCLFILTVFSVYVLNAICEEQERNMLLQAKTQQLSSERSMVSMTEQNLETLRGIRHDLKNQYSYMRILLQEKRYEELNRYFDSLLQNIPDALYYVDCGNKTVNGILNMEISKATMEHITVEHQLVVPPMLPFPADDLCSILTNLIDNAIEECRRLRQIKGENGAQEGIHIEIYPQKSYLYLMVQNATDRKEMETNHKGLRSTKKDASAHGYGTKIVAKIAEKYNGCVEYNVNGGKFTAKVLLDMIMEERKNDKDCIM